MNIIFYFLLLIRIAINMWPHHRIISTRRRRWFSRLKPRRNMRYQTRITPACCCDYVNSNLYTHIAPKCRMSKEYKKKWMERLVCSFAIALVPDSAQLYVTHTQHKIDVSVFIFGEISVIAAREIYFIFGWLLHISLFFSLWLPLEMPFCLQKGCVNEWLS